MPHDLRINLDQLFPARAQQLRNQLLKQRLGSGLILWTAPHQRHRTVPKRGFYMNRQCLLLAMPGPGLIGQSTAALPSRSDVYLLRDIQGVIDLDAEIPDRALNLGVTQEQLNSPKVSGSSVDQGRLGPAK